ncbi:MAG: zf-HC2 domain-containing protein [Candidatus Deferrimicrobiaceae bacterium]
MECRETRQMIQDHIDGQLPPRVSEKLREHLGGCDPCASEEAELRGVGDLLRLWSAVRVEERELRLSALWTRVGAGIEERGKPWLVPLLRRWFWVPAAAVVAVLTLLFYPLNGSRAPFHPKSFDVTVESLESDTATVALVDKGEDLPRVIWIIENGNT